MVDGEIVRKVTLAMLHSAVSALCDNKTKELISHLQTITSNFHKW